MRAQTGPNQRHQNGVNLPRGRHLFLPDRLRCIRRGQIDDHGPLFLCLERFLRHEYPSLPKGDFFLFFFVDALLQVLMAKDSKFEILDQAHSEVSMLLEENLAPLSWA